LGNRHDEARINQTRGPLLRHGFLLIGQSGSHQKWRNPGGSQVIVAMHGSKPIPKGTLASIIQGSGLDLELFRE
jgi:predicted RNA binding protein YcfA (HicA-like mRNA interferase family)